MLLYDMMTVARKELKEIMVQRGSLRSGLTNLLVTMLVIGVLFPLQWGAEWITSPVGLISTAWLPMMLSMGLIADTFAGERERHTLETLLASRLSDRAILFGKILAAVVYAVALALAGALLGAATVNMQSPGAGFYPAQNIVGMLVFSLLGALAVSGLGVLVSLRAETVRQAYQRMSLGFLILWLPLILGPQLLPEAWKAPVLRFFSGLDGTQIAVGAAVLLLVLAALFIGLAMARFQRSRLIEG